MKNFREEVQKQFATMNATGKLFKVNLTGQQVWELYLASFKDEHNPIFRDPESSVHNCNHCKNFIRRYGNIVAISEDFEIMTIFDVTTTEEFQASANAVAEAIKSSKIQDVFFETFIELNSLPYESCKKTNKVFQLGVESNHKQYSKEEAEMYGVVKEKEIRTFEHLSLKVDKMYVDTSGKSIEAIRADYRDAKNVFFRGMIEIPLDTLNLVIDLINQGSLLNGDAHSSKIVTIKALKEMFDTIPVEKQDRWAWIASHKLAIAKFKNELIGVLCSELAQGEEINKACQSWNKRVDPANYMKAVAPITTIQKKNAQEFVEENGYVASFNRRHAVLDDININEIRHINVGNGSIKEASMFDNVKTTPSRHKRNEFEEVEEVGIEKFMQDILPGCESVEVYLENPQEGNLVTMTTSKDAEAKQIFKWNNPFSWTYNGNLAGKSMIKEAVKTKGGKVDGVFRFSIMWADGNNDNSDLDAWCSQPKGENISYQKRSGHASGGNLDIDIQAPSDYGYKNVVENITFPTLSKMKNGVYKVWVNQYSSRNSQGFTAEVEFGGEIFEYSYNQPVGNKGNIQVAEITLKDGAFSIKHILPCSTATKELYGLETKQFHKVDLVCSSPNHWGENQAGNKHYFFMLENCKCDTSIRSFHSENLEPELSKHRKVLEVLGAVSGLEPVDKQLSGLGFNATVRDEVIVRLKGNFKRVIKIKF